MFDRKGGLKRESFIGDATFLASGNFCAFGYIHYWPGDIVQIICGWRVQYPTGIQVRYLSLDYCSLLLLWEESSCFNFSCGWYPGSGLLRP